MKKVIVTLPSAAKPFNAELIQIIAAPNDKGETEVLAVCMDEEGYFDTYALDYIKGIK